MTCRSKIYNKFAQSLESKSVHSSVGNHLLDWVCQDNTRLAKARDQSTNRGVEFCYVFVELVINSFCSKNLGLTRAEVTFYCTDLPLEETMICVLSHIVARATCCCRACAAHWCGIVVSVQENFRKLCSQTKKTLKKLTSLGVRQFEKCGLQYLGDGAASYLICLVHLV